LREIAEGLPGDFCFATETADFRPAEASLCEPPQAFTEHGVVATAYLLRTPHAMAAATRIVRTFVQFRTVMPRGGHVMADLAFPKSGGLEG
jgi:hypothetical protein